LMAQPQHVWVSVISCGDFERHRPTRSCRDRWQSPPFRTNRVARQRSTRKGPHEMIVNGRDAMASRRNFDHSNRRS
jgi:hypothetical protein